MDRLYPKFNRKSQPIAVIRAKRELWRKNREKPAAQLPSIKLMNNESIVGADFDSLYGYVRDWKWLPKPEEPKLDVYRAKELLRNMQMGVVLPRIESLNAAMDVLIRGNEDVKPFLPLIPEEEMSNGIMAFVFAKEGNLKEALKLLAPLKQISKMAMCAYEQIIKKLMDVKVADLIYTNLAQKCLPSKLIVHEMIWKYAKNDYAEKALKIHTDVCRQGFYTEGRTLMCLIYAACNRKEMFPDLIDYFRQLIIRKEEIRLENWNDLLIGCSKTGNLDTALQVWRAIKESGLIPNLSSYSSMLWALAACETRGNKISVKRDYYMNVKLKEVVQTGFQLRQEMRDAGIKPNATCLTAYLALMCNNYARKEAEKVFYEELTPLKNSPRQCEMLAGLYDSLSEYSGAVRLMKHVEDYKIAVQFPFWRSIIRVMAMTNHVDEAAYLLAIRVSDKERVEFQNMKEIYYHAYLQARSDVMQFVTNRASDNAVFHPQSLSKHTPLRKRSLKVADFLKEAYGQKAPQCATDDPRERELGVREDDFQYEYLERTINKKDHK